MKVEKISKEQWASLSENAHKIAFSKIKPASWDRIDFALMSVDSNDVPTGYVTCRETDPETLYWQFGGAFPSAKGTAACFRHYKAMIDSCKGSYKRITTLIENTNISMLRMAMAVGFHIVGLRVVGDSILLEHLLEFEGEKLNG